MLTLWICGIFCILCGFPCLFMVWEEMTSIYGSLLFAVFMLCVGIILFYSGWDILPFNLTIFAEIQI